LDRGGRGFFGGNVVTFMQRQRRYNISTWSAMLGQDGVVHRGKRGTGLSQSQTELGGSGGRMALSKMLCYGNPMRVTKNAMPVRNEASPASEMSNLLL
jgi:hypothetical protein